MDTEYANGATLDQERAAQEDSIHYANVDFVKLQQAAPEGQIRNGELGGSIANTIEYAQIRLHSSNGDREVVADTDSGEE